MEWQSSSLILFLLCFLGCCFLGCWSIPNSFPNCNLDDVSEFAPFIVFFTLLPQLVCSCYLHRLLLLSLYCCCYDWWIRNNTSRCTEPNSSLLLLCKFCTLPRLFLLFHLCCHCHGRRSLSSIKQPRLLILHCDGSWYLLHLYREECLPSFIAFHSLPSIIHCLPFIAFHFMHNDINAFCCGTSFAIH